MSAGLPGWRWKSLACGLTKRGLAIFEVELISFEKAGEKKDADKPQAAKPATPKKAEPKKEEAKPEAKDEGKE